MPTIKVKQRTKYAHRGHQVEEFQPGQHDVSKACAKALIDAKLATVVAKPAGSAARGGKSKTFANWMRGYYIVDRFGIRTLRDPFTDKPYIVFYTTKRVGGMVVDSEAIKVLKTGLAV